ncbi:MAG: hypothetical protein JWN48_4510 [Myxococcaceae bacterium]|nr:hypothetical protein [Myxococcaceae bacterium]
MLRTRAGVWMAWVALTLGGGCSDDAAPVDGAKGAQNDGEGSTPAKDGGASKDGGGKKLDASTTPPVTRDGAIEKADDLGGTIPCDVQKLVVAKCGPCHGAKPAGGAPMSLVTLADFHKPAVTDNAREAYELASERMAETDPTLRMPPTSVQISAAETKSLTDWLKAGARGTTDSCTPTTGGGDAGTGGTGGTGGISIEPIAYDDPDLKCYEFRAFAKGSDRSKPYSVPTTPDLYVAFTMTPEFKGTQYVKSFRTLIDNAAVLHHWLFFKQSGAQAQGVVENAVGTHPDGDMLAGWAPGGSDSYFDKDVGMEITGGVSYQLEAHYNNKTGAAAPDRSGVEICVSPNKPEHVATVSWLGTDSISGTSATGTCTPRMTGPVHLIGGTPHMHIKGRHMKVTVNRQGGAKEVIHDDDFDFQYQRQYVEDVLLNPGDTLTTTCTYSAPSRFGKGTNDEMCYFFSTAWPAGQLSSIGAGTLVHGPNACLN